VIRKFLQHVVPGVIRPLRVLWNEVIGFFFLVLAVVGLVRSWPQIREPESPVTVVVPVLWVVVMTYFAVTSFIRARRISRS
jgi:hypothetical protein